MKTTAKLFLTLLLLVPLCAHASDGDKDKLPLLTVTKAAGQQAPFVAQGNQRSASVSQVRASRA